MGIRDLERTYRDRPEDIYIGTMSSRRRIQLVRRYRINEEGYPVYDDILQKICDSPAYRLTLPGGNLYAHISKYGRYDSYANADDRICHDMTKELAIKFDEYLYDLVGIDKHILITN